jgi:ribonuclease-3 family protein
VGDAVYELFVRTLLIEQGVRRPDQLHRQAVELVRAEAQARFVQEILPELTEDERELIRRGRNSKAGHVPKGVDPITYRYSTGFEVLLGYLYLCGRQERLREILAMSCR